MVTGEAGLDLLRRFEGFSAQAYRCAAGHLTIGYGHVVRQGEVYADGISEADALALLARDVVVAEDAVRRCITAPLNQAQFDALVSFVFNLGGGALQRSSLRRKVNRQEHDEIPGEFLKWVWASGKKLPGLIRRRRAEAALYTLG
ncbi:MAG: lysozyme [Alphaproteobacteria bacterium]|nr:lysozyme [Alphaproteobacteria bacterium]